MLDRMIRERMIVDNLNSQSSDFVVFFHYYSNTLSLELCGPRKFYEYLKRKKVIRPIYYSPVLSCPKHQKIKEKILSCDGVPTRDVVRIIDSLWKNTTSVY